MSQVTRKPLQPATEGIPGKRFRPFRRTRKVIGAIALTALGITLASTAGNAVLEQQERSSTAQYGHLVEVAGGALNGLFAIRGVVEAESLHSRAVLWRCSW